MDERFKKIILKHAEKRPEKFFPTEVLKEEGFSRKKCSKCGKNFWSTENRDFCDEPECSGGYKFIGKRLVKEKLNLASAWEKFSKFMGKRGYEPIKRYPVAARWREDTDFVQASIYDFQPHVVSGEVEPPANPLVVPQFCLRFNDIDNVGITGRHYSGFIMVGQHAFEIPKNYLQGKYFQDMLDYAVKGLGIKKNWIIIHEDAWAGGGNLGACLEFFAKGLELFNQVYMFYEIKGNKIKDLKLKVLDMGMGYERIVWLGTNYLSSYQANMPKVVGKILKISGIKCNEELKEFMGFAGLIDFDRKLKERKLENGLEDIFNRLLPLFRIYAIADHTRALLVAINDGVLPSNSGGGYNLRILARRTLDFKNKLDLGISISDIIQWHAEEIGKLYPELKENYSEISEILEYEEKKYGESLRKAKKVLEKINGDIDFEKAKFLYSSHGITPDMAKEFGFKVRVPENFYAMISERKEKRHKEEKIEANFPETELLYMKDNYLQKFEAEVIGKIKDYVVLDKTGFYATSGGQIHDTGTLTGKNGKFEVVEVKKIGKVVLHKIRGKLEVGEKVRGEINFDRRKRLMKHHTATHVINGACRKILGNHVWQAGAEKDIGKARLDITHYKRIEKEEMEKIEELGNKIVRQGIKVEKLFMKRNEAEKKFGFRIYQGGHVPGNILRIVKIGDFDIEACGGTHVDNTREIGAIKITGSKKIQDGVIRLEFSAGEALKDVTGREAEIERKIASMINYKGKVEIERLCEIFKVRKNELISTLERFLEEYEKRRERIIALESELSIGEEFSSKYRTISGNNIYSLFELWKEQHKDIEKLEKKIAEKLFLEIYKSGKKVIFKKVDLSLKVLSELAKKITSKDKGLFVVLIGKGFAVASSGEKNNIDALEEIKKIAEVANGDKEFATGFKLLTSQANVRDFRSNR